MKKNYYLFRKLIACAMDDYQEEKNAEYSKQEQLIWDISRISAAELAAYQTIDSLLQDICFYIEECDNSQINPEYLKTALAKYREMRHLNASKIAISRLHCTQASYYEEQHKQNKLQLQIATKFTEQLLHTKEYMNFLMESI